MYWQNIQCCTTGLDRTKPTLGFFNCYWGLKILLSSVFNYSRGHPDEQSAEIRIRLSLRFVKDQDLSSRMRSWKFIQQGKENIDGKKPLWMTEGLLKGGGGGNLKMWSGKSFGQAKRNSWEYMTQKQMTAQKGLRYKVALFTFGFM